MQTRNGDPMSPDHVQAITAVIALAAGGLAYLHKIFRDMAAISMRIEHFDEQVSLFREDLEAMSNQVAQQRESIAALSTEIKLFRDVFLRSH